MANLKIIITIVILSLIEIIAFYNLKKFSQSGNISYYLIGLLSYGILATILAFSFKYSKIGIINGGWNIVSIIYGFLIGYLLFNEKLTTVESIGAIISFIGLLLMTVKLN